MISRRPALPPELPVQILGRVRVRRTTVFPNKGKTKLATHFSFHAEKSSCCQSYPFQVVFHGGSKYDSTFTALINQSIQ